MDGQPISFGPYRLLPAQRVLLEGDRPVRLGSRAFDILAALVERAGEVVGKEQLIARAWPQTFVEEANLKIQVSALRRALGDGQGGNRYVITVPGRGYNFVAPVRREQPSRAPPAPTVASAVMHNLPFAVTRMIGRDDAVAALVTRLSRQRLVTIVGAGGIGKTTVALAVAERMIASYEHGVWLVDLAPLGDPRLVPSAVATVLGLKIRTEDPLLGLAAAIKDSRLLLLLDNCEHVIDAVAGLAATVLSRGSGVRILTTSREPFGTAGESEYHLGPLAHPPASLRLTAAEAAAFPAVQLFVERVSAIVEGFALTDANAPAIAEICRRLDGLPLAIEFAAPRVEVLGVEGLAARLDDSLQLLGARRRMTVPRQRTMRAVVDWSYGLLSEDEQRFFRALGIFKGVFTVEAAASVAMDAADTSEAIDRLADLVAKSLVVADVSGTKPQFRLFDTTRAYALEKLRDHGEFGATARRHAVFYRNYLEELEESWSSLVPVEDGVFHGRQVDNIRAAIEWAFSPSGDGALGMALTVAAVPFLLHFSLIDECAVAIRRVLTGDRASHARTRRQEMKLFVGLASAVLYAYGSSVSPATFAAWKSGYEIAAELNDPDYRLRTLWGLWINCYIPGDLVGALDAARQFTTLAPGNTPQADLLVGERILGLTLHVMGDHGNALRHIDHMLQHYVAPPNRSHLVRYQFDQQVAARCHKSLILWVQGLPEQASRLAEYNLDQAEANGHPPSVFYALALGACPVAALGGDSSLAQRFIQRILDTSVTPAWNTWAECFRGVLMVEQGRADGPPHLRAAIKETGSFQNLYTWALGVAARGLLACGELKEANDTIQEALDNAANRKERWCEPELLRIKAEVVAALGHWDDAGALFRQSLAVAQEQGALSWELRTATSLARLLRNQGRPADAIACLRPVYGRFTEGFGTADLIAAKQLLDELRDAGRR